ncbi:MAG: SMC-Scp complex subunit ScpB [Chloroflexi bacterium]|nr:SMC-Scp complex subunit ScpB [Chloroflexota bacterium]
MTTRADVDNVRPDDGMHAAIAAEEQTVSVAEAAVLLGRDRTRVYALLRSGDLVAAPEDDNDGRVRILRASIERWLVAGGASGAPLSPRNAWALIGLASGDEPFSERCLGLLERAEELSRTRTRFSRGESLVDLAPRLRRRATLIVRHLPRGVREALERDAALVRTAASVAAAYGWDELVGTEDLSWRLDAYISETAFASLQEQLNHLDVHDSDDSHELGEPVLLRAVDEPWPFPPNYPIAPQPLAALDLLDYPDQVARRTGRELLNALGETKPLVLARRSAKARAMASPLMGRLLNGEGRGKERPRVEGDPKTDTRAAAAHIVGVLWASASQGLTVKELRAAVGLSRERFEDAYELLGESPPLGLMVQRHGDELRLVTAPEVSASVERHLNNPRPVALSNAALEVLAIVAYRQPIARSGIEHIRGSASDSAIEKLLERGLIAYNPHHLFVTTRGFLSLDGLSDLTHLPELESGIMSEIP